MKSAKIFICCCISIIGTIVFTGTAAASSPELFSCEGYAEGEYTESKCATGSSGEYERNALETGAKAAFTMTGGGITIKTAKQTLECSTSESGQGETSGPLELIKIQITMKGCKEEASACHAKGDVEGEIKTNDLVGKLVFLKKSKAAPAGVLLEPEAGSELAPEIECNCPNMDLKLTGSVIGEVKSPNEAIETNEIVYGENSAHTAQRWTSVEEEGTVHELQLGGEKGRMSLAEKLKWSESEQLGVATEAVKVNRRFEATGKNYPLVLSAAMTSAEQVIKLGPATNEIACTKVSFTAPKLRRRVITVVLTPTVTDCTLTYELRADPNVVAACNVYELFSGGTVHMPICKFQITDIEVAHVKCEITITGPRVAGNYASINAPAELEVSPETGAGGKVYSFASNAACKLSEPSGDALNTIKFVVKGTNNGAAEGFEVK